MTPLSVTLTFDDTRMIQNWLRTHWHRHPIFSIHISIYICLKWEFLYKKSRDMWVWLLFTAFVDKAAASAEIGLKKWFWNPNIWMPICQVRFTPWYYTTICMWESPIEFYVMWSLGRHLLSIAYVKVDVFSLQKMYVLMKLEELVLNYSPVPN